MSRKRLQYRLRRPLVQRLVVVSALGRLDAGWAASTAGALRNRLQRRAPQFFDQLVALIGDADAAGVGVVDEHLRLPRIGVRRRGQPANVIPVAQGVQRQHGDGGVLGGDWRVCCPR
jgi:hypothetical protein